MLMLTGQPVFPPQVGGRFRPSTAQISVESSLLIAKLACGRTERLSALILADVVYDAVPHSLQRRTGGDFLIAVAPRLCATACADPPLDSVWFLRVQGCPRDLDSFVSQLSRAGVLRTDLECLGSKQRLLSQTKDSEIRLRWTRLPRCVAVKTEQRAAADIWREVEMLSRCQHPNIINFEGIFCLMETDKSKNDCQAQANPTWSIATQFASRGDLLQQFNFKYLLDEMTVSKAMLGVASALGFLHKVGIVHRDVKTSHVLLSYDGLGILADFSSAVDLQHPGAELTHVGCPHYVAPEICCLATYDEKVDIFSCGVILYLTLSGRYPFPGPCASEAVQQAKLCNVNFNVPGLDRLSDLMRVLLSTTLSKNPRVRPSARAIFVALWGQASREVKALALQSALSLDPKPGDYFDLSNFR